MPRTARLAPGGLVYHALNRGAGREGLFRKDEDYEMFERVLAEALEKHPTRLLAYCLMPNHWHLVLWPRREGELTAFIRWVSNTHTMRWHSHYQTMGMGHVYQGRFKSFPIEAGDHLAMVLRYVESNPLRARLVRKAEAWRWSSLHLRQTADPRAAALLHAWPMAMPRKWMWLVNQPQPNAELEAIRRSVVRGCPCGSPTWQARTARRLELESTLRPRGRPRKQPKAPKPKQ